MSLKIAETQDIYSLEVEQAKLACNSPWYIQYNDAVEFLPDARLLSVIDKTALTCMLSGRIRKCTCTVCSGLVEIQNS